MRADNATDFSGGELARRKKNCFLAIFTASLGAVKNIEGEQEAVLLKATLVASRLILTN